MRLFAFVTTALLLPCCYAVGQRLPAQTSVKKATAIEGRCAVIVQPDDKRIERMKRKGSEDEYNAVVDDNQYYLGMAIAFLDSVRMRQIVRKSVGTLTFKGSSGQYFKVGLDSCAWGIILFNGRAKPISADVTDIGSSYQAYMKK